MKNSQENINPTILSIMFENMKIILWHNIYIEIKRVRWEGGKECIKESNKTFRLVSNLLVTIINIFSTNMCFKTI